MRLVEESVLKIFHTLSESKYPLAKSDISKKTGMSVQLVNYWINKLIQSGIVLRYNRKTYSIQPVLKDKSLIELIKPLIEKISCNLKYEDTNIKNIEDTVEKCVALYLLDNITE